MDGQEVCLVPPAPHLDTVRALHQTVVSLRTALELSKNELKELKEKYQQHSRCNNFADTIEKLTIENHILRRKIINTQGEEAFDLGLEAIGDIENIDGNVNSNLKSAEICNLPELDNKTAEYVTVKFKAAEVYDETIVIREIVHESTENTSGEDDNYNFGSKRDLNGNQDSENVDIRHFEQTKPEGNENNTDQNELSQATEELLISQQTKEDKKSTFKTKIELLSKFDVSIKVRTLEGEENFVSSTTSESGSTTGFDAKNIESVTESKSVHHFEETFKHEEVNSCIRLKTVSREDINMAVPGDSDATSKNDKFNVQVRITSEENLVVEHNTEKGRKRDTLNLDVDDLSLRSMSEGDNSVFSEEVEGDERAARGDGDKRLYEQDNASDESEEVDDIELIFTTDESKDMSNLQEDLVSIQEGEPWVPLPTSKHSTPILIKFSNLDPELQPGGENTDNVENENQENTDLQGAFADSALKVKRVSLPNEKEIKHVGFSAKSLDLPDRPGILKSCGLKHEDYLSKTGKRLDSMDSLLSEYNRGLSFDTTKSSSFELGSSMDILNREEGVDSFHQQKYLGHRFSVFGETDISKCGISEENLGAANLNARRNTCPNPFQYKALPHRSFMRQSGPFKATGPPGVGRTRPILRADNLSVRRENGAQTEVSALPPRWSSDGYLAHKVGVPRPLATLPSRVPPTIGVLDTGPQIRGHAPSDPRPRLLEPLAMRSDEARRVLLSDIGFTSMVPELSRSADPVWAETVGAAGTGGAACTTCGSALRRTAALSPTRLGSGDTSRYLARGTFRSHCHGTDHLDWSSSYVPAIATATRKEQRSVWRSSLPDVRHSAIQLDSGDSTDELMEETEGFLRRSIDNLRSDTRFISDLGPGASVRGLARPYIPAGPRHLRLGHTVKLITPHGRIAIGIVRYVGLAGSTAADSGVMVGAVIECATNPCIPLNDGTYQGRRYFRTPPGYSALFVPFPKVVMAWAN